MVLSAAPLPLEAVRQQIASAIDVIVHLSRMRDKSRKVLEISEISGCISGRILMNPLYKFEESGETPEGKIAGSLKRTGNAMLHTDKYRMAGITCRM